MIRQATLLAALCSVTTIAQAILPDMREALTAEFKFTESDLAKLESGAPIARMVPTGKPDDVRMAGAIRIKISSENFMRAFRDVEHFQFSKEALQTGRFSLPARESDLEGFHLTDLSKNDVMACRPGACAYKIPANVMQEFQTKIDWSSPEAGVKAEAMAHKLWVDGLRDYQQRGDPALVVYYDTKAPYSVAEGLHSLIGGETRLWSRFPELMTYAEKYPSAKPAGAEDLFYWQEAAFGLKHVLRIQHVIAQKIEQAAGGPAHYAMISKMLFASHYFRAAIEFNYVYPIGADAIYFVTAQRSYVDGMTGFKGSILRKVAEGRSPATLSSNLKLAKRFLEKQR